MIRVALYLRRSTEEHQATSLEVQRASATLFAAEKKWEVAATFEDSGISGSEFVERPGLRALKDFCAGGGCSVVLVRALDRIGRDTLRAVEFVRDLDEMGVELWCYSTGSALKVDRPESILSAVAVSLAGDVERRALVGRITEGLRRRAERGLCVGGDVYGYTRQRGPDGVRYVVHPDEARVVRELFERRAQGEGIRTLVRDLNARAIPSPSAGTRGTGSWAPSAVSNLLHNRRYLGELTWGRQGTVYKGGTRKAVVRADDELVRVEVPELALIDRDLWERVRAQDAAHIGRSGGAPGYLLTGHVKCAGCGGPIGTTRTRSHQASIPAYCCAWARDRGETVCGVRLRRPTERLDAVVLDWIETHALAPRILRAVLAELRARLDRAEPPDLRRASLETQVAATTRQRDRLVRALADLDDVASLKQEIRDREEKLKGLRAELERLPATATPPTLDWPKVEREVLAMAADLKATLRRDLTGARAVLAGLLDGEKLNMEVDGEGREREWRLTGAVLLPPRSLLASLEPLGQSPRYRHPVVICFPRAA